jgi:hypothetical protein
MTDSQALRAALREAAEKATPGEWKVSRGHYGYMNCFQSHGTEVGKTIAVEDAAFIALANPQNVSSLLSDYAALEARCAVLEKALQKTACIVQMAVSSRHIIPGDTIAFTGEWKHLGAPTVREILDEAEAALAQTHKEG